MWTQQQVDKGRQLVQELAPAQWKLGDLALEVVPDGTENADTATGKFAEEIGVQASTLRTYRKVSAAWPESTRPVGVAYGLCEELRNDPDRVALLQRFLSESDKTGTKPTIRRLRVMLGRSPKDGGFSSASTVEYNTRKALADPSSRQAVLNAIAENDEMAREVTSAYQRRRFAETDARTEAEQGADLPRQSVDSSARSWAVIQSELAKMVVSANEVLREIPSVGSTELETERALASVRKIEHRLDWIKTVLEGGSASLDSELAELLSGE